MILELTVRIDSDKIKMIQEYSKNYMNRTLTVDELTDFLSSDVSHVYNSFMEYSMRFAVEEFCSSILKRS